MQRTLTPNQQTNIRSRFVLCCAVLCCFVLHLFSSLFELNSCCVRVSVICLTSLHIALSHRHNNTDTMPSHKRKSKPAHSKDAGSAVAHESEMIESYKRVKADAAGGDNNKAPPPPPPSQSHSQSAGGGGGAPALVIPSLVHHSKLSAAASASGGGDSRFLDFSRHSKNVVKQLHSKWSEQFLYPSPNTGLCLANAGFKEVVDRDAAVLEFLNAMFDDMNSSSIGTGTGTGTETGADLNAPPPPRRRLLATHSGPGGGKSRFLDVVAEMCGPPTTEYAKRVWSDFNKTNAKDARLIEFQSNMRQRIPIPITFNGYQTESLAEPWPNESALAARILHG